MAYIFLLLILTKNLLTIFYGLFCGLAHKNLHNKIHYEKLWRGKRRREEINRWHDFALMAKVSTKELVEVIDGFEVIEKLYMVLNSTWKSCIILITQKLSKPPNVPLQCLLFVALWSDGWDIKSSSVIPDLAGHS